MKIHSDETEYGLGVTIELTGDEIAIAIDAWLMAHRIVINGPQTILVNGSLIKHSKVYVDPSAKVIMG